MARREIKNTRKGFVNPTTRTGKIVHAPNPDPTDRPPKCGRWMTGIMFTDEAVNCPSCLEVRCSTCNGLCWFVEDAWVCSKCGDEWYPDHGPEYAMPAAPASIPCRTCGKELTPEHFHEENYAFRGEDGY